MKAWKQILASNKFAYLDLEFNEERLMSSYKLEPVDESSFIENPQTRPLLKESKNEKSFLKSFQVGTVSESAMRTQKNESLITDKTLN